MTNIKTWADGEQITPADMQRYISDVLHGFMAPPSCRRTVANLSSQHKPANAAHVVQFDKPAMGKGSMYSYDTTGGLMSTEATKIHAPIDGLYEMSFGLVVRAATGDLGFATAAVNLNQTTGSSIAATGFLRVGLGRSNRSEKVGAGSATIALDAGDFISAAAQSDTDFVFGDGDFAQFISHMELRWVGVKP
ncbi:hypothetical protein [Streptomyces sp. NPDC048644]|uniref:hypothetical protein n=1 Tax=Streptomyces sp. NPDC048644 TaxID=3365582 RepID=UPI003716CC03